MPSQHTQTATHIPAPIPREEFLIGDLEYLVHKTSAALEGIRGALLDVLKYTHWRDAADRACDVHMADIEAVLHDAIVNAAFAEARAAGFDLRKSLEGN